MPNVLSIYDPIFYAAEALIQLEKALGMANAVHRGYDKNPQDRGSVISIRRPSTFTALEMPNAKQDLLAGNVDITLNQWFGVTFALTDKDLTFTQQMIIDEHIRPAAYALADKIDQTVAGLYKDVPWTQNANTTTPIKDFTQARRTLFDLQAPNDPRFYMINGEREAAYLELSTFHEADKAGQVETQIRGTLGQKFGFTTFANQNVQTHTAGALTVGTAFELSAAVAKGATSISLRDSGATPSLTGTVKKGDTLVIAGNTQRYAVTADATAAGNAITLSITPAAVVAYTADTAVTVEQDAVNTEQNLAYHRNAFALAMAPLSQIGDGLGVRMATAVDPVTSLALRSRIWYEGSPAEVNVGIDALWGVRTLDGNLAVRVESAP